MQNIRLLPDKFFFATSLGVGNIMQVNIVQIMYFKFINKKKKKGVPEICPNLYFRNILEGGRTIPFILLFLPFPLILSGMEKKCFTDNVASAAIQGGPERMQQLWLLISWSSSMKQNCLLFYVIEHSFSNKMTPWSLVLGIRCLECSAILVRQCNCQNLVLFWPNRPLEHRKTLESRCPVLLTKPSHWKQRQCEQTGLFITQHLTPWSEKFLLFQRSRGSKK